MNKTELINVVAEKTGLAKKDVEKVVTGFTEAVTEAVANGEKVQLVGFGTFEKRTRSERMGRDPRSGKEIKIPASTVPAFKAGKVFKEAVK